MLRRSAEIQLRRQEFVAHQEAERAARRAAPATTVEDATAINGADIQEVLMMTEDAFRNTAVANTPARHIDRMREQGSGVAPGRCILLASGVGSRD